MILTLKKENPGYLRFSSHVSYCYLLHTNFFQHILIRTDLQGSGWLSCSDIRWIGKSASVPSEVCTVSDIVTTGFMIVIFAGSRIPRHISFCQLDRLASVSSAWCRCSGDLYAGIRCTVEDHNTLIGTLSENDPSMSAVVSDISRIKLPV